MSTEAARAALTATASTGWRKSTRSGGQNGCVEINRVPGYAGVRDSKLGDASPVLVFSGTALQAMLDSLVK